MTSKVGLMPSDDDTYWGSWEDTYDRFRLSWDRRPIRNPLGLPVPATFQARSYEMTEPFLISAQYFLEVDHLGPWQSIPTRYRKNSGEVLAISHLWHGLSHPDPERMQLAFLQLLALGNPNKVFFYDYCSLPQHPRTNADEHLFRVGMRATRELYMNNKVVLLGTDDRYFQRSWCIFESSCHLLSKIEKPIGLMSLDNPAFLAHLLQLIEGEKYKEANDIGVDGWKDRVISRVTAGETTEHDDRLVIIDMMESLPLTDDMRIKNSEKGCLEVATPRGFSYVVAN